MAVRRRPHERKGEAAEDCAPGDALRLIFVAHRRSEDARLRRLRQCLLRGNVHVLAATGPLALVVGDERGAGRLRAGVQIRLRHAEPQRGTVCVADIQSARGVNDEVALRVFCLWPGLPESADRDVYQRRVDGGYGVVVEPQFGHPSRRLRLDQKVRAAGELQQVLPPLLSCDVERDAAFVPAVGPPVKRLLRARLVASKWTETSAGVAFRRLDRNHVGSEVGQYLAAEQATFVGEIEDSVRAQH